MLRRLGFALTHPSLTWRFAVRTLRHAYRRRTFSPTHQPLSRPGFIQPTKLPKSLWGDDPTLRASADRILGGELCLYGHALVKTGRRVDWQRDYRSKQRWPLAFALTLDYRYPKGVDIKNPWELSRGHQLVVVALAYQRTGDERYAEFVAQTLDDWIRANPFYGGVNWKVAMEVGIRAVNWLVAIDLISASPTVTVERRARWRGALREHGQFIWENLEYFGVRSNHYFSDLVGLVWIGTLVPDLSGAARWRRYGERELAREIRHQFYPDGLNFEGSTAYHRLMVELAGYTILLLKAHARPLSDAAIARLQRALEAALILPDQSGRSPQFGDNDSGRLLITENYHHWSALDWRYLERLAAPLGVRRLADRRSRSWPNGGLSQLRAGDWTATVSLIPIGQDGNGGHNHDDAGSFELSWRGSPVIVDPGTAGYTSDPERRNLFRSASRHNAPVLTGKAHQPPALLFVGDQFTVAEVVRESANLLELKLIAEQYTVWRQLKLTSTGLQVTDRSEDEATTLTTTLLLPPERQVKGSGQRWRLGDDVELTVQAGQVRRVTAEYSPAYGQIEPTTALVLTGSKLSFEVRQR